MEQMTKQNKLQLLYDAFSEQKELSTSEIMSLLNLRGKSSVANYIASLKDLGIQTGMRTGKNGEYLYHIAPDSVSPAGRVTSSIWKKFIIASLLQNGPLTKTELWNHYLLSEISLGIRRSAFDQLRNELIHSGDIVVRNRKLYLTGKNIPIIMPLTEQAFIDQMNQLASIPPNEPFRDTLVNIYMKHCLLYLEDFSPAANNFLCYGKTYLAQQQINILYGKLNPVPFDRRVLSVRYRAKNGILTILFSTGLIVYSVEKNRMYLLGRSHVQNTERLTIINLDTVIDIRETDLPNTHYQTQEFRKIYTEMFSISIEPLTHVRVRFQNLPHIEAKLKILSLHRKATCRFAYTGDYILYEDDLRGINDFRNYLRSFGHHYTLLEPLDTAVSIRENLQQHLSVYEELRNEQV